LRLANGDHHVCFGPNCEHAEFNKDRHLICTISGLLIHTESVGDATPAWTGRSSTSNNPDDNACVLQGAWKRKRDMFSASASAWEMSKSIKDDDVVHVESEKELQAREGRASIKRGALCVDEEAKPFVRKRIRTSKKEMATSDTQDRLKLEALTVIERILTTEKTKIGRAVTSRDERLQNPQFVSTLAIRAYVEKAANCNGPLDLLTLHDIMVHANEFVRNQREEQQRIHNSEVSDSVLFTGHIRSLICNLIISLWKAVCLTPYMKDARKGNDSFRPFASGILYALKRGLYIGKICAVPQIDSLASRLPTLRSVNASAAAKQLHASSHRGLCSLHRSIASMNELSISESTEMRNAFRSAAAAAECLRMHADSLAVAM